MKNSEQLIAKAREWIGTPYQHQGRLKHVGCDCLGVFVGVADELQVLSEELDSNGRRRPITDFDKTNYSSSPNTAALMATLDKHLDAVEIKDIAIGDLVIIDMIGSPQHIGIITDYVHGGFGLLHSLSGRGVVEHCLDKGWLGRIYKAYRMRSSAWLV